MAAAGKIIDLKKNVDIALAEDADDQELHGGEARRAR